MIQFHFTGNPFPSIQEQQEDRVFFLEKLGPFTEEFDSKDGTVTFNHSFPSTDSRRVEYYFGKSSNPTDLIDFIGRWNRFNGGHISHPS